MSTKEEALKKARGQKEEVVRVRGDALQQIVEEEVRKALGDALKAEEEGVPDRSFLSGRESYLSTKEEALRKTRGQKDEDVWGRGDALQQTVEEDVRKAFGGARKAEEKGVPDRSFLSSRESYPDRKVLAEEISPKGAAHSIMWLKGIYSIAVNIKLRIGEGKKGAILFASSVSGEGTTTICSHVSLALAKICPGNVLLLDCNAQHPEIHRIFKTEASPGLTDVLMGKINWEEAIRKSTIRNFFVLPFGRSLTEPLTLLGSEAMEGLLGALKSEFDFLILDAPPILGNTEAELIVRWVEASVIVIRGHNTRREVARHAVERMVQHKEFLGAVFNQQEFTIPQFLYKRLR